MPERDHMAAKADGRSRLRASDADRDQAVDVLKGAFVQGRLAKDEFELRVGQVLAARTYSDLDALTAGIPAGLPAQRQPPADPSGRRRTSALVLIPQAAWTRRRPVLLGVGLLLLFASIGLASPMVFIFGMLVVGLSAPPAIPSSPEAAVIRTWQWLYRRQTRS